MEDTNLCALHAKRVTISEFLLHSERLDRETLRWQILFFFWGLEDTQMTSKCCFLIRSAQRPPAREAHPRTGLWRRLKLRAARAGNEMSADSCFSPEATPECAQLGRHILLSNGRGAFSALLTLGQGFDLQLNVQDGILLSSHEQRQYLKGRLISCLAIECSATRRHGQAFYVLTANMPD